MNPTLDKQYDAWLYIFFVPFYFKENKLWKQKQKKICKDVKTKIKFTFPNEVRVIANFVTLYFCLTVSIVKQPPNFNLF